MGVPDFLKFVVRHAPSALCKISHAKCSNESEDSEENLQSFMTYDYVLIDATNISQTIGLEKVYSFLSSKYIEVKHGVIFALDAERSRAGASRFYRQTHLLVSDLAVQVNELCRKLQKHYEEKNKKCRQSSSTTTPFVVMSGREVAGEADYKVLDIQRSIVLASLHTNSKFHATSSMSVSSMKEDCQRCKPSCTSSTSLLTELSLPWVSSVTTTNPTFLFITEDSDVLCGVLCGPFPQNCSIVTTLHDTTFELCILHVEHVMLYIANCVQALSMETREMFTPTSAIETSNVDHMHNKPCNNNNHTKHLINSFQDCCTKIENKLVDTSSVLISRAKKEHDVTNNASIATDATVVKREDDNNNGGVNDDNKVDNTVRRRKVDGPMIATGTRVEFSDSESDIPNDVDEKSNSETNNSCESEINEAGKWKMNIAASHMNKHRNNTVLKSTSSCALLQTLTSYEHALGHIVHCSSVDLVFLFVLIMGDGVGVPPLMPGVTKIDIASCWKMYCDHKYVNCNNQKEATFGRCLIELSCELLEEKQQQQQRQQQDNDNDNDKRHSDDYTSEHEFSVQKSDIGEESNVPITLNYRFLHEILSQVHYADVQPRAMGEDEEHRAAVYLSHAVYSTFHYIVACNVKHGLALTHSFLDTRHLAEVNVHAPSLTAVLQVLKRRTRQTYHFRLHGVPSRTEYNAICTKKERLQEKNNFKEEHECDLAVKHINSTATFCSSSSLLADHKKEINKNYKNINNNSKVDTNTKMHYSESSNKHFNVYNRELKIDVRDNLCAPISTAFLRNSPSRESSLWVSRQTPQSQNCTLNELVLITNRTNAQILRKKENYSNTSIEQQIISLAKQYLYTVKEEQHKNIKHDIQLISVASLYESVLEGSKSEEMLFCYMRILWSWSVGMSANTLWALAHGESMESLDTQEKTNRAHIRADRTSMKVRSAIELKDSNNVEQNEENCNTDSDDNDNNNDKRKTEANSYMSAIKRNGCVKYVYSFELRRMTPIWVNRTNENVDKYVNRELSAQMSNSRNMENTTRTCSDNNNNSSCGSKSKENALLKAIGVSLDYAKQEVDAKEQLSNNKRQRAGDNEKIKSSKKHRKLRKLENSKMIDKVAKVTPREQVATRINGVKHFSSLPSLSEEDSPSEINLETKKKVLYTNLRTETRNKREETLPAASCSANDVPKINEMQKSRKSHYRPGKRERRLMQRNSSNNPTQKHEENEITQTSTL